MTISLAGQLDVSHAYRCPAATSKASPRRPSGSRTMPRSLTPWIVASTLNTAARSAGEALPVLRIRASALNLFCVP